MPVSVKQLGHIWLVLSQNVVVLLHRSSNCDHSAILSQPDFHRLTRIVQNLPDFASAIAEA
ncbi:MAG: hypothetical protein RID53_07770 [Coleofasciculus sp. B1-GNL1-01]